jgi:hypothetical protein
MDKAKLTALIALLYAQGIDARAALVKNAAKENGMKEGDLFKLLDESGYDHKAVKGTAVPGLPGETPPAGENKPKDDEKKISVILRHKTGYPKYRRAGLALTQKPETYQVTEAQLEKLHSDPWVVIEKENELK